MSIVRETSFTAKEIFHLRPCGEIVKFAEEIGQQKPWVTLFLLKSWKVARGKSITSLLLLGIKSWDEFSLRVEWWDSEQVDRVVSAFRQLVTNNLSAENLHSPMPIVPDSIDTPSERHPEHMRFQEQYDFFLELQDFFAQYLDFLARPDSLTLDQQREILNKMNVLVEREREMLKKWWTYPWRWPPTMKTKWIFHNQNVPLDIGEVEFIRDYFIPNNILPCQQYLWILPHEVIRHIEFNLHLLDQMLREYDDSNNIWWFIQKYLNAHEWTRNFIIDPARVFDFANHEIRVSCIEYTLSQRDNIPFYGISDEQAIRVEFRRRLAGTIDDCKKLAAEYLQYQKTPLNN